MNLFDGIYIYLYILTFTQFVSIYAAYLYDSAKLYAWALDELLRNASQTQTLTDEEVYNIARDGTKIIETIIKNGTYKSKSS